MKILQCYQVMTLKMGTYGLISYQNDHPKKQRLRWSQIRRTIGRLVGSQIGSQMGSQIVPIAANRAISDAVLGIQENKI